MLNVLLGIIIVQQGLLVFMLGFRLFAEALLIRASMKAQ